MDLAPCSIVVDQVVKASQGHYPQPFLISNKKNYCKYKAGLIFLKIIFPVAGEQADPYIVIIFSDSILT